MRGNLKRDVRQTGQERKKRLYLKVRTAQWI